MGIYIDRQFIGLISLRLDNFTNKGNDLYNFRCPFCGDSSTNKAKKRGYLYRKKQNIFYKCHNCGVGMGLSNFIKRLDPTLYDEYSFAKFKDKHTPTVRKQIIKKEKQKKSIVDNSLDSLECIAGLSNDHHCKEYVNSRVIPVEYHCELYYAADFGKFVKETRPDKHHKVMDGQNRLVIPFFSKKGKFIGYQGRGLSGGMRYITITFDESENDPFIFGMDKLNSEKTIYILEGPIDSMFVENSIALAGSTKHIDFDPKNSVLIFDNECRSKEIVSLMQARLHDGYGIFIWPSASFYKDINLLAMGGWRNKDIMDMINNNTYRGMSGELHINLWKRI